MMGTTPLPDLRPVRGHRVDGHADRTEGVDVRRLRVDDGADIGPLTVDRGVHLDVEGRLQLPSDLLAAALDEDDVLGAHEVVGEVMRRHRDQT